ncbi:MAG TPA: PAS domain S-box protein, partial [Gaiellales bacterium]|nr:PAS domain S-box protein [Gaiellales bacterium]
MKPISPSSSAGDGENATSSLGRSRGLDSYQAHAGAPAVAPVVVSGSPPSPRARSIGLAALAAAAASGLATLAGFATGTAWLTGVYRGSTPMRPLTAVLLLLLTAATAAPRRWRRYVRPAMPTVALAVSATMLAEELTHASSHLDRLIFGDALRASGIDGRISPNTAIALGLVAIALLLLPRAPRSAQVVLFAGMAIGLVGVTGYVVNVAALYRIGGYTTMSATTAVGILLLGTGVTALEPTLLAHRALCGTTSAARLNRITLPFVVGVPLALAGIIYRTGIASGVEHSATIEIVSGVVIVLAAVTFYTGAAQVGQERELRRLQDAFATMLELAPEAILGISADGRIAVANRQAEVVFGYPADGMVGEPAAALLPPVPPGPDGEPESAPALVARRRDGSPFPCEVSSSLIETHAGALAMTVVRDRSEFREAEQRFRALAEAAPIGIYELGPDGAPVYVNDQALTIAGLNRRRFAAGASLESHVGVARRQRFRRPLAIGSDETPESFEFHHPDGSTRHALRLSRPLSDPSGDVRGYVCLLIDVTEDIRVRRQLSDLERRRTEVIEQLVRAGEEERARIATELHDDTVQVLAAALIMIDRMAKQTSGELLDRVAELRQMVSTASERARRMTFELRPQVLEASGLGDAVELLAEQLRHDHPGLSVEVDASIPRQSETIEQIAYR